MRYLNLDPSDSTIYLAPIRIHTFAQGAPEDGMENLAIKRARVYLWELCIRPKDFLIVLHEADWGQSEVESTQITVQVEG